MSAVALTDFNTSMGSAISDKDGLRAFVDTLDLTTGLVKRLMRLHWIWLHLLSISVMPRHGWQNHANCKAQLVAMDDVSDDDSQ